MNDLKRVLWPVALVVAAAMWSGCNPSTPITLTLAPPGPADLGAATGLSTPPADAVVFDLKYRVQTGAADDILYHSFYGFGGVLDETKTNAFLESVRQRASGLHYVHNSSLPGRKWAAVEYRRRQALAFYFDLDADGRLSDRERLLPTRKTNRGVEFVTPDFVQPLEKGGQTLCRLLLQVNFFKGDSAPNCMWSPASLLEASSTMNGQAVHLRLFAGAPAEDYGEFGSSSYSLDWGAQKKIEPGGYVSRETLSSVVTSRGEFYRLAIEGRRSNGLPARVVMTKDTSPTGTLTVRLAGSNSLQTSLSWLSLHGVEDKTVFFQVGGETNRFALPVGVYALDNGSLDYGASNAQEWKVSFSQGPFASVRAGGSSEQVLGHPTLKVRAIKANDRWLEKPAELTTFKQGTQVYLEPRIVGKGHEVFRRFQQATAGNRDKTDRPPRITITGPDGKELLSKVMEYG